MSHTPGPWIAQDSGECSTETSPSVHNYYILTPAGMAADAPWIATVQGVHVGEKDQSINEANARLIAAAPELLEALKTAEIALVNCVPITRYHGDGPLVSIRAAIARATGGAA